jgi:hypothetical protein
MPWKIVPVLAVMLLFSSTSCAISLSGDEMSESLKNTIRMVQHMALNPLLIKAVRQQNFQVLDMEAIQSREQEWKAGSTNALKESMLAGDHATLMRRFIDENRGLLEICLTDSRGANVAAYPLTDDYWQGDEEEWIQSFNEGKGQVFIGSLKRDEETDSIFTHVSAPVYDRNKTIGVLVVAVRLGGINN